jgi:pimeloyl-ACP methyl ester carboxylesterase
MTFPKKLSHWVSDYGYMIHGAVLGVMHRNPPEHYTGYVVDGKVPVVMIPGVTSRWAFLKRLADAISLLGHPVYIVPSLGNNLYSVPESAKKVYEVIAKENLTNVVLVAHSKGGLIGKYLMSHDDTEGRVIRLISIATPYSGSAITKLLPIEPIKELHNDSELITYLKTHTVVNSKITSICPLYDNHVWAEEGSHLEGAKNVNVEVNGHHKVVYSKQVEDIVVQELEEVSSVLK